MKKLMLAIVAMTVSVTMMAQSETEQKPQRTEGDKTEMVKQRTAQMVEKYELNETQAEQLLALNTEYADKMVRPMRIGRPAGPEGRQKAMPKRKPQVDKADATKEPKAPEGGDALHRQMQETREKYDAELQKIMTEKQFEAYKADGKKRFREGRKDGPRTDRPRRRPNN